MSRYRDRKLKRGITNANSTSQWEAKCTHACFIFNSTRVWLVPRYLIRNYVEETILGRAGTGDAVLDRQIEYDVSPVNVTLAQLAPLSKDGHRMGPVSNDIGCEAFYHLTGHLIDWANYLSTVTLFEKEIPIVGLREINTLASYLYDVAVRDGYVKRLKTKASIYDLLSGRKAKRAESGGYGDSLIKFIEKEHRKRSRVLKDVKRGKEYAIRSF